MPSWCAPRERACEPRSLPRDRRWLGAPGRPGGHADGRQRDRRHGGVHALGRQRQPRRRVRRRTRDRRLRRGRAERGRPPPRSRAARGRLRALDDGDDDAAVRRGRPDAGPRRRSRRHAPGPRRQRAAERAGATVRWAEPDRETLALPASAIEAVLSDRTRWVAVTAASNATGTVPELGAIVAAAHRAGARVSLDAVAAAPHRALSLAALGADTIVCSAYKWYGPHIGILCAAPGLLEELEPDKLIVSPDEAPDRFELGTLPFESLAGVTAAAEYMLEVGFDAIRAHEEALMAIALDGLSAIDGVTLYGSPPDRVPTLMFNVEGRTSTEVATALAAREVAVWDGNYYAWELERFLGLAPHGAVRAGFVHYNDESDARRLVEAVADVAAGAGDAAAPASPEETPA